MLKRKFFIGIALVLLLSLVSVVMAVLPTLTSGDVSPSSGNTSQTFTFTVNFTDGDNDTADDVIVTIDGTNYSMSEVNSSDVDTTDGKSYTHTSSIFSAGTYIFNFTANNGSDTATTSDDTFTVNAITSAPTITDFNPLLLTYNSYLGTPVEFNVTSDQIVDVTWTIGAVQAYVNSSLAIGTKANYTNSTAGVGEYTVVANASNANGSDTKNWTWNVTITPDTTPPASVTNLTSIAGMSFINWTWTDPIDADFDKVDIFIDGTHTTFVENGTQYYTGTFSSNTTHTITVYSVDNSSNTNSTNPQNNTNTTLPNTISDGAVSLGSSVVVNFTGLTGSGNTSMTTSPTNTWVDHSSTFSSVGTYYDINTTAPLSGYVIVEVPYTYSGSNENLVRLYHFTGGAWVDVTSDINTGTKKVYGNVTSFSPFVPGIRPAPGVSSSPSPSPAATVETIGATAQNFTISFNQTVNVTWLMNGSSVGTPSTSVTSAYYLNSAPTTGTWNITVTGNNSNGSVSYTWTWTVRPKTYSTGNRVWDASKEMSLIYTWNPMSFYAFYYDLDGNVGNESLQVTLDTRSDRNIDEGDLVYTSTPQAVAFEYSSWGTYNVVGFMAEKYFAGYTAGSNVTGGTVYSTINSKQLHKVLTDEDTKRTVYVGSTMTLGEGYVLKVWDIDITGGKQVIFKLLKDGGEVDLLSVAAGDDYIYSKKVGSVGELPIILIHLDTVFSGSEANAAFIKGIFQLSESYTSVNQGNKYGIMKVTGVSDTSITMENDNSLSLSAGTTNDVMGDIKFKVADNSSVLRFAPTVQKTGVYEVRGTISPNTESTPMWNPMSFEGFYYDLDEDVGSENITLTRSGRTIEENDLVYTSTPESVSFEYSAFGSYNVVGFMAQKYFAGYTALSTFKDSTAISTINSKQLHKVLTDDDKTHTVYGGSTLTLNEGYVLKVFDVDITGGKQVIFKLLKDGDEVDLEPVNAGEEYTYSKKVGSISDLPIIVVHIDTVFSGAEANAAFVKGIFQISESYTTVNTGDQFGIMKVSEISDTKIQMKNTNTVTLSSASNIDIMGDIKFKVADDTNSSVVRFYPYIMVDSGVVSANTLTVDAPANLIERDTITITVTAGSGTAVDGAEVSFDSTVIGTTDSAGTVNYTLTSSGLHNISATKLGYEAATKSITVEEYVETRLSLEVPTIIDQGVPVIIKVTSGESTVAGASITLDSAEIGTTGINGELSYAFEISGTHNLGASKTNYISVVREINIRMPFSEYKALDINLTPPVIFEGEETVIKAKITNTGTKADDRQVELIINGTVVDNKSLILEPGEVKEINFTREVELPKGNYTVEILGQKDVLRVDEKSTSILLIGGILTGLGAIIIYFLTSKKITLMMVKEFIANLNAETVKEGLRNAPRTIRASLRETAWKLKDMFNEIMSKFRKQ